MEEGVREVLYESRYHASRPYSPNYPPQHQQVNQGVKGSLLSLLSTRGVSQLKEKWSGHRHPRKLRKWISLFVSARGECVAIAVGNQITIFQKDDDYQDPCGFFTGSSLGTFTFGIWSESHDVFGVADDSDVLYFIKANGEEITRITRRDSKVPLPIIGFIAHEDSDMNKSCLCSFNVLTSDRSIHEVDISQDPSASILSARTPNNGSTLKEFPKNVFCLNCHPEISLLAVVGGHVSVPVTYNGSTALVALKSSQLVGAISPSIEICPEDLLTVDSAVSCFSRLCGDATSERQFDALLSVLAEWEGLYTIRGDEADSVEAADAANDWSNDDWVEGWESFQEEPVAKEIKKDDSLLVHPLHVCWLEIFKKLVMLSRFGDIFKLIDQSIVKSNGVLRDQVGAHSLSQILLGMDCFVALKLALLFPYEAIQLQCLDAVEDKLKRGGTADMIGKDHEFFILVLSSGLVSTIISRSSYGTTFSFLCYMVGNFSRQYQEAQLSSLKHKGRKEHQSQEKDFLVLFREFSSHVLYQSL